MTKWLPSLIATVTAVGAIFAHPIQDYITAHAALSAVIAAVYAILSHLLPSPVAAGNGNG